MHKISIMRMGVGMKPHDMMKDLDEMFGKGRPTMDSEEDMEEEEYSTSSPSEPMICVKATNVEDKFLDRLDSFLAKGPTPYKIISQSVRQSKKPSSNTDSKKDDE